MVGSGCYRSGLPARAGLALACLTAAWATCALTPFAPSAQAAGGEAWWHLGVGARPSTLAPEAVGEVVLTAENVGDARAVGTVTVTGSLPAGWRVVGVAGSAPKQGGAPGETVAMTCAAAPAISCQASGPVVPYGLLEVRIAAEPPAGSSGGEAVGVSVSGGAAPPASYSRAVSVGGQGASFGVEEYGLSVEAEGGGQVTQAGAHPFQATGTIALDQGADANVGSLMSAPPDAGPAAPARDIVARLPPGLIANPGATTRRCLSWQFSASAMGGEQDECPYESAVGAASVTFTRGGQTKTVVSPIFNIEPEAGEPARFGFFAPGDGTPVVLNTGVRSEAGEDWGVNLSSAQIPEDSGISSARLTFWGVPGRALHDEARGWGCLAETQGRSPGSTLEGCDHYEESKPRAFVTLPTSCTGPLSSSLEVDSWAVPNPQTWPAEEDIPGMTGCESVPFSPSIETAPTTHAASSPSGLTFGLNFDSEDLTSGEAPAAQSDLEKTVVTLPEGMTIDPSAGVGLGACSETQYASATLSSPPGAGCPEDSKLGTVTIETPLLFTTVEGSLYLAQPYSNPFGSLIALYVVARSRAERGILVKLAGRVSANPATGRLTVTFEGDPPLPFGHFTFHFREGAQAPLITPATCGTFTTQALLTPFSAPENPLEKTASFQITSGSEGSACPGSLPPFAPRIQAGTLDPQAGVFSPFYVELARTDAMSEISTFSASLPEGLTANLSGVPFCPEADIERARAKTGAQEEAEPSCPSGSLIGHTLVGTGVGAVLDYVPGRLYLSGPFHGDPLSVVSITSAVIGPFDLGTIVIRFALRIDPYTARVSIDPSGSEPIPTIIDGIVTHVRDIRVSIDRSGFTLNPTACQPAPTASTLSSPQGQAATVTTPFAPDDCDELAFKPKFSASTDGRTSRTRGASLQVKLTAPIKLGAEANIRAVKVELPHQLPSRLTTLQQACTEAQFNANPAGCPHASFIGQARATTPILPVPLTGPAIFVSHGGESFPSLILVLQGYNVTIDLVGSTYISPQGITSTTFKTVPDEPVGSFEMTLPEGRYSALAALGDFCHLTKTVTIKRRITVDIHGHKRRVTRRVRVKRPTKLTMPTEFVAQNGIVVRQNTKIAVTGCPKAHAAQKKKGSRGKGKGKGKGKQGGKRSKRK